MTDQPSAEASEDKTDAKRAKSGRARRKERVPLSAMKMKLDAPAREGFVRRWVNDDAGRIQDFERAGYACVEDQEIHTDGEGSRVARRVGVQDNGDPLYAFLMEQKQDWYNEDQATKQAELDKVDAAIKRGDGGGVQNGQDGRYVPSQGITYER